MSPRAQQWVMSLVILAGLIGLGMWRSHAAKMRLGVTGGFVGVIYPRIDPERISLTMEFDAYQGDITIAPTDMIVFDRVLQLSYPSTRKTPFVAPRATQGSEVFDFDAHAANGKVSRELALVIRGDEVRLRLDPKE